VVASRCHNVEVAMRVRRQNAVAPPEVVDENEPRATSVDEPERASETAAGRLGAHDERRMTIGTDLQLSNLVRKRPSCAPQVWMFPF
jgi:hypothetical protein